MSKCVIRAEQAEDIQAIENVIKSAFEGEKEARLVALLRNSDAFVPELSLVAISHDRVVAHVLLTKSLLEFKDGGSMDVLVIAPESVVPSHAHKGIGSGLVVKSLLLAKELGFPAVFVAGEASFQQRFGFRTASDWDIETNIPIPAEQFMGMELKENSLKSGRVVYPDAFTQLECY